MSRKIHFIRKGQGKPILLIHGLGGSWNSWTPILDRLAHTREVIAIDLPGHGKTPPLKGKLTISTLADSVAEFLAENNLIGIDVVGSSMGARLALELARRDGIVGSVVSLDPGGFWNTWQKYYFYLSLSISIRLLRVLKPVLPKMIHNKLGRNLLFFQFSSQASSLSPDFLIQETHDYLNAKSFDELLRELAFGEKQKGTTKNSFPMLIVWGKRDRICFKSEAKKARELFPDASFVFLDNSGHFPHWDQSLETIELIEGVKTFSKNSPLAQFAHDHFPQQESHA